MQELRKKNGSQLSELSMKDFLKNTSGLSKLSKHESSELSSDFLTEREKKNTFNNTQTLYCLSDVEKGNNILS
jgi:hypothetical protein